MSAAVKVKGVSIEFADGPLVVPPLSLASIEELQPRLALFNGDIGSVGIVIDSLHHALKRNYPTITREEVGELVDMGNMQEVMDAVMNVAGLRAKAGASGEAKAANL